MSLGMVDLDVVERFRDAVGCGAIYTSEREGCRTIYRWQIGKAAEIVAVLDRIEYMLSPRRQAAAQALRASLAPRKRMRYAPAVALLATLLLAGCGSGESTAEREIREGHRAVEHINQQNCEVFNVCKHPQREQAEGEEEAKAHPQVAEAEEREAAERG
jgi:hypothetical protein